MTITLRLLAAASHAYHIREDGPVAANTPAFSTGGVGYVQAPLGVRAGVFQQDAGFVATIPEGVLISIRGTTPPSGDEDPRQVIIDWATDAVADLDPSPETPPGFPGKVHFGFYKSFMRLWAKLGPRVQAVVSANPGARLFVTGHSKGGAICPLVAWRLRKDFPGRQIVVRAFAPARTADGTFAAAYNAAIPDHIRYEFDDDIVPHLPLRTALVEALGAPKIVAVLLTKFDPGYGEIGRLKYICDDLTIVDPSPTLDRDRVDGLLAKLPTSGGLRHIVSCHSIDAGSGYARAPYPP